MEEARSKTPLVFFAGVLILSIVAVFLLVNKCSSDKTKSGGNPQTVANTDPSSPTGDPDNTNLTTDGDDISTGHSGTSEELVGRISEVALKANNSNNAQPLIDLLGQHNLTPSQIKQLHGLAAASRLKLDPTTPFSPVPGTANQWSLNLADQTRIYLDISKTADGKWKIGNIILPKTNSAVTGKPGDPANPQDPAAAAEAQAAAATVNQFIDSIIKLDPAGAGKHIDPTKVSYATLAGLCIIFEEGKYTLLKEKALRNMFLRDTSAGWLARLEAKDSREPAMFAINMKRKDADSAWKITEISMDKLLADYASRVSGGDLHYSPLIKNPQGGDSLVIYFDLDSNDLTPRTKRQLAIVGNLLKSATEKKLTISGHTDALGSDQYNLSLSRGRAEQVMQFLAQHGVAQQQMKIIGYGKTKPRLPNRADDGSDSPEGRRANRRAEILLDF